MTHHLCDGQRFGGVYLYDVAPTDAEMRARMDEAGAKDGF